MKKNTLILLLLTLPFIGYSQTETQDESTSNTKVNSWNFEVTPYLFAAGMEGDISFLSQSLPVDAEFSDLLDHLSFGAMLHGEANKGKWTIMTDVIYMKLKNDGEINGTLSSLSLIHISEPTRPY